jgi:hypothetical protein
MNGDVANDDRASRDVAESGLDDAVTYCGLRLKHSFDLNDIPAGRRQSHC